MVVSGTGHIGFVTTENQKLTGVEVRPDGVVRLKRKTGWAVMTRMKAGGLAPGQAVAGR